MIEPLEIKGKHGEPSSIIVMMKPYEYVKGTESKEVVAPTK